MAGVQEAEVTRVYVAFESLQPVAFALNSESELLVLWCVE
jgi:hypothetical protein